MTASPTPFFAESANKSDGEHYAESASCSEAPGTHAKIASVQPAPAAMPREEEIARVIMCARDDGGCEVKDWAAEERSNPHVGQALRQARAVLALFAPILAEKEGNVREAVAHASEGWRRAGLAQGKLEASELAGVVDGWKARALAAEAALAAVEKPGTYFANQLQHEWIGPDGVRYSPTRGRSPFDVEF